MMKGSTAYVVTQARNGQRLVVAVGSKKDMLREVKTRGGNKAGVQLWFSPGKKIGDII